MAASSSVRASGADLKSVGPFPQSSSTMRATASSGSRLQPQPLAPPLSGSGNGIADGLSTADVLVTPRRHLQPNASSSSSSAGVAARAGAVVNNEQPKLCSRFHLSGWSQLPASTLLFEATSVQVTGDAVNQRRFSARHWHSFIDKKDATQAAGEGIVVLLRVAQPGGAKRAWLVEALMVVEGKAMWVDWHRCGPADITREVADKEWRHAVDVGTAFNKIPSIPTNECIDWPVHSILRSPKDPSYLSRPPSPIHCNFTS